MNSMNEKLKLNLTAEHFVNETLLTIFVIYFFLF